jgi:GNAT superfamily N-acetyltransferase
MVPGEIGLKPVKVKYLKMDAPPEFVLPAMEGVSVEEVAHPISVDHYLQLYRGVGLAYNWLDRLVMDRSELAAKINVPNVRVFALKSNGADAGFSEFVLEDGFVEILYFGLMPEFVGRGLGSYFLRWCIRHAWSYAPLWIQLNTCELDHPNALPTYLKLCFHQYKETIEERRILR